MCKKSLQLTLDEGDKLDLFLFSHASKVGCCMPLASLSALSDLYPLNVFHKPFHIIIPLPFLF